jgi:hypothetical protein
VEELKCLGTTLTNQNYIQEEIKSKLKPMNACCHSVQILLLSSLLSKNINMKINRTIILLVVFYGCENRSLTFREEHRLMVFENRVLDLRGTRKQGSGEYYIMTSLLICTPHQTLSG